MVLIFAFLWKSRTSGQQFVPTYRGVCRLRNGEEGRISKEEEIQTYTAVSSMR